MALELYSRTMSRAAELAGGADKLAVALRAPPQDVRSWINGERIPPLATFFAATRLIRDLAAPDRSES